MQRLASFGVGVLLAAVSQVAAAPVVLETDALRIEVNADGMLKSLQAKPAGTEYAWLKEPAPVASVQRGGKWFPASSAELKGDQLTVGFESAKINAVYKVMTQPAYLAFELTALTGEPVDAIRLIQLRIRKLPNLGPWIDVAYDDAFGVCLCGGNVKTDAGMQICDGYVDMSTRAEKEIGLAGTVAILFGCPEPRKHFLDVMEIVERDFQMPSGARHRRSPMQQYSYLMAPCTPVDVDRYIAMARQGGFRMLLFSYTTFTSGAGHFAFNEKFAGGIADVKKMADAIRAAGLKVGIHIHYNKAHRNDAYVTPVPDDRFHKVREFKLATAIDAAASTISVRENPEGCTRDNRRRILKIGKELVSYGDYTTSLPFQFTGCERGHLKTQAAAHAEGETAGLLDVDDTNQNAFIRFDQTTDIQDEAAECLTRIINESGPYDLIYFDGAEDVHDPRWYHVANAQYRVYRRFAHEPPVCETATMTHFSWHMMSRSNAYDLPLEYGKSFCYEVPCRTAPVRALDFTRIDFGWLQGLTPTVGVDVLEYVVSRGAGWDCPISIPLNLKQLAAHPRSDDCLEVFKTWEDARLAGKLTDAHRRMLRTLDPKYFQFVDVWDARMTKAWTDRWQKPSFNDQEHHLFMNERGEYELVPIREVSNVAGGQVKAFVFSRDGAAADTYVLLWAVKGQGTLRLDIAPERLVAMRPFGKPVEIEPVEKSSTVPMSGRAYLCLKGMTAEQTVKVLQMSQFDAN